MKQGEQMYSFAEIQVYLIQRTVKRNGEELHLRQFGLTAMAAESGRFFRRRQRRILHGQVH
jgi:hypothetical protein